MEQEDNIGARIGTTRSLLASLERLLMDDRISILMGFYNAENTIERAIASIQNQTYENWELICCDDGSTDGGLQIVQQLAAHDERIKVIRNDRNRGLGYALNRCFEHAEGDYLARMDADDESLPTRLEKELAVLKAGEFDLVSTGIVMFDGNRDLCVRQPISRPEIIDLFRGNPIVHPACMMTRTCFEKVGGYSEERSRIRVEDIDLWIRLYRAGYRCFNLNEALYRFRYDYDLLKRQKMKYRWNAAVVCLDGCRTFRLPAKYYVRTMRPLLIGLIPPRLRYLRFYWKLKTSEDKGEKRTK